MRAFCNATGSDVAPAGYVKVGNYGQTIVFPVATDIAYGEGGHYFYKYGVIGGITFDTATWGDPSYGKTKFAYAKISANNANQLINQTDTSKSSPVAPVNTDAEAKNKKYLIYAAVIAVVLIAGIFIYKKLKNK